jgi:Holliday junction resolvase RusA-like endonuclease
MKFDLPIAPSTNHLYANAGKRRIISKNYEKWLEAAGIEVNAQRSMFKAHGLKLPIEENAVVCLFLPYRATADLDNRFKASLDLMVKHNVLKDDNMKVLVNLSATIDLQLDIHRMQVMVATADDMMTGHHTYEETMSGYA